MPAAKRKKKLTNAEKNMNRAVKKKYQQQGILPPDKKRLNRKQFAADVLKVYHGEDFNFYYEWPRIMEAFEYVLPFYRGGKIMRPVTQEQVGALKVLKLAMEMKAFSEKKKAEGIKTATLDELYNEVIKPVLEL